MMRVPLNVGWPPQIAESATICRPSSMRVRFPLAFAFMPMPLTMRPVRFVCKPVILDEARKRLAETLMTESSRPGTKNKIKMMKILKNLALAAVILTTAVASQAGTVRGYFRSNGTYAMPHHRTPANGTPYDNLSYRGYPSQQPGYVSSRAPQLCSAPFCVIHVTAVKKVLRRNPDPVMSEAFLKIRFLLPSSAASRVAYDKTSLALPRRKRRRAGGANGERNVL